MTQRYQEQLWTLLFCVAQSPFFLFPPIKRAARESLKSMQSYTSKADELFLKAQNVEVPDYIPPYTSCYETLYEQEEIITRAREMDDCARDIRQQFQAIADSGFPLPTSTLLRKAVVSVKKGKFMFSPEQLSRVVQMIMEKKPYLLFRPKSDTKDYVILVFWSTSFDDSACSIQQNAEVIKQEVLADGYQLRFKAENIPSPRRFTLYMLNNFITLAVQNDDECQLPPQDHKQLESFLTLLDTQNIASSNPKKRKLSDNSLPKDFELSQNPTQRLDAYLQ